MNPLHRYSMLASLLLSASFALAQAPPNTGIKPASSGEVSRKPQQAASAFDYLPLQAGAKYTWAAVYQRRGSETLSRDVYTIVTNQ